MDVETLKFWFRAYFGSLGYEHSCSLSTLRRNLREIEVKSFSGIKQVRGVKSKDCHFIKLIIVTGRGENRMAREVLVNADQEVVKHTAYSLCLPGAPGLIYGRGRDPRRDTGDNLEDEF